MLLLVVGLVVIVLVILVAVFLSVRSMRADEGDDYPAHPAGAARAGGGRGAYADQDDRASARRSDPRKQPARPAPVRGNGQPGRRSQFDTAERDEPRYDQARFDQAPYEQAPYEQAEYEQAEYGGAGHERTRTMTAVDEAGPRGYRGRDRGRDRAAGERRDRAAGERDLDRAPRRRRAAVAAAQAGGAAPQRRFGSLPRPRGHQHDKDAVEALPRDRDDARRVQRPESRLRAADNGRDRSEDEWPAGDWGSVSDEQYWAELSADKPLATTARSAQPGTGARPAESGRSPAASVRSPAESVRSEVAASGRRARLDADSGQTRQQASAGIPVAAAPTAKFSLRPEPGQPAAPVAPIAPDTDPSIGRMTSWQDTAGHGAPTDPWTAPGRHAPGEEDAPAWTTEDPLTSPSFSSPAKYSVGAGAYQSAPPWESLSQDADAPSHGDAYDGRTAGWPGTDYEYSSGALEPLPEAAGSASGRAGSWYPRTADAGLPGWQGAEPGYDTGSGHDSGHGTEVSSTGYGDDHAGYSRRGLHSGDADGGYETEGGHQSDSSYQSNDGYSSNGAYQSNDSNRGNGGYSSDSSSYQSDDSYQSDGGYSSDSSSYQSDGGYSSDSSSYQSDGGYSSNGGHQSNDSYQSDGGYSSESRYQSDSTYPSDSGYELPGHEDHGAAGHNRSGYGLAGTDRHEPGYDRDDPGHQTGSGWTGSGHEQPGYGPSGTGYQAPGFGSYSDYDSGR
jgi:hypothetical protein